MSTIEQNQSAVLCKVHERTSVALLLAMLGGFLDAYTYILKNGVFANAQTGNLVLLSIAVFNGKHALIPKYALPILFFSAGILLSEFIKLNGSIKSEVRKIKLMLVFEALLLVLIGAT
ncbi:YoaK family protein, partial [Treponema lecithinolyticum]